MLELLDEIESDLSVYHRIEEVHAMPGPRFARLAPLLPAYGGAVAQAIAAAQAPAEPASPVVPVPAATPAFGRRVEQPVVGTRLALELSEHSDLFEFGS